jgi:hypothetical protein
MPLVQHDHMIDHIARGERIQETLWLKGAHTRCKCQEFQLLWIFETDTVFYDQ